METVKAETVKEQRRVEVRGSGGRRLGLGLGVALAMLGQAGLEIRRRWESLTDESLLEMEPEEWEIQPEESHPATRWLRYRRVGVACALLRHSGRRRRPMW